MMGYPLHAWWILIRPDRIDHHLDHLLRQGIIDERPTIWQIELGVLRMWHRVAFRSDTIGTCATHKPRTTWRAKLLNQRLLRGPFLFWERAIAPLDHSGLAQPLERLHRHLMAAHHDKNQFAYDLQILKGHKGALEALRDDVSELLAKPSRRAEWLRDLVVYEGYHENLLQAVEAAIADAPPLDDDEINNPDISFDAYIRWCLAQPATPAQTLAAVRHGTFPRPLAPAATAT